MQSLEPSSIFTVSPRKLPGVYADARSLQDVTRTPYNAAAENAETPAYKAEVRLNGIQMLHITYAGFCHVDRLHVLICSDFSGAPPQLCQKEGNCE